MNETLLIVIATAAGSFMVVLAKAGHSPDFRAAVRTTSVGMLGWYLAVARFGVRPWSNLSWQSQSMLVLSLVAALVGWRLYFNGRRSRTISPTSRVDRFNVLFAVIFAVLLMLREASKQSLLIGLCLVSGALILAFGSR